MKPFTTRRNVSLFNKNILASKKQILAKCSFIVIKVESGFRHRNPPIESPCIDSPHVKSLRIKSPLVELFICNEKQFIYIGLMRSIPHRISPFPNVKFEKCQYTVKSSAIFTGLFRKNTAVLVVTCNLFLLYYTVFLQINISSWGFSMCRLSMSLRFPLFHIENKLRSRLRTLCGKDMSHSITL